MVPRTCSRPPCAKTIMGARVSASSTMRLVMMFVFSLFMWVFSIQEISLFLLFFQIVGSLRIHALHLAFFFGGELRQMANETDQLLGCLFVVASPPAPAGHAGHSNAVLDNEEQL